MGTGVDADMVTVVVDGDAVDVDAVAGAAAASGVRSWSVGVGFGAGVARLAAVVRFVPEPGDATAADGVVAAICRATRDADAGGVAAPVDRADPATALERGAEAERVDAFCRRVATGVAAASRRPVEGEMLVVGGRPAAWAAARFAARVNGRRESPLCVAGFPEGWLVAGLAGDDPDLEGLRSALDEASEATGMAEGPEGREAATPAGTHGSGAGDGRASAAAGAGGRGDGGDRALARIRGGRPSGCPGGAVGPGAAPAARSMNTCCCCAIIVPVRRRCLRGADGITGDAGPMELRRPQ